MSNDTNSRYIGADFFSDKPNYGIIIISYHAEFIKCRRKKQSLGFFVRGF